ncbi:hypothetical protein [Gordonia hongkongensis]|nr:hypothetical protein [Gordonia terrae]
MMSAIVSAREAVIDHLPVLGEHAAGLVSPTPRRAVLARSDLTRKNHTV